MEENEGPRYSLALAVPKKKDSYIGIIPAVDASEVNMLLGDGESPFDFNLEKIDSFMMESENNLTITSSKFNLLTATYKQRELENKEPDDL